MAILPELLVASPTLQDFLIGKDALPLAAGVVTCYHDNSRTTLKNWYYQSGTPARYTWIALPNPLTLSAAGTIQNANGDDVIPFFYPWFLADDGIQAYDPYYITVYDSNGELQFTRAFFPFDANQVNPNPPTQDIFTLENLLINNRFWRNVGTLNAGTLSPNPTSGINYINAGNFGFSYNNTPIPGPGLPPNYYYATLAPSQNDGFSMPDFNYIKNAQGGAETISFKTFPATTSPALGGDVMPEFYIEHVCGTQDTGVSIKVYQFPISLHLKTLAGQQASVSIQARSNTGGTPLKISLYKFQGSGNTSMQGVPFGVFPLTTGWLRHQANFEFPGDNLTTSSTGDDAWYLQIGMPVEAGPFEIDFTLPSVYLNPSSDIPTNSFESYDVIDTIISKPRTGDLRIGVNQFYPYGWVPMNNGTIGNTLAVPFAPTARNNIDTWPLFNLIWNLFAAYSTGNSTSAGLNPIAPMYLTGAAATQVGYGPGVTTPTTALSDWNDGKQLSLTRSMGQVMLGTVPLTALLSTYTSTFTASSSGGLLITIPAGMTIFRGMPVYVSNVGGTLPDNLFANTIYYITADASFTATTFHLSFTFQTAMAGTPQVVAGALGTPVNSISSWLSGTVEGEYAHSQLVPELAAHHHTYSLPGGSSLQGGANVQHSNVLADTLTSDTGNSVPFNVTQPGTFNNIYIKL